MKKCNGKFTQRVEEKSRGRLLKTKMWGIWGVTSWVQEFQHIQKSQLIILYNEKIITKIKQKLKMWKNYVVKLLKGNRRQISLENIERELCLDIIKDALDTPKNRKVSCPDRLLEKILILIEEDQFNNLVEIINIIYTEQQWYRVNSYYQLL